MSWNRTSGVCLLAFSVSFFIFVQVAPAAGQAAQLPERPEQHQHGHSMDMNTPSGVTDKCGPKFTYEDGPLGPAHWEGVCNAGHMQTPIDITQSEKVAFPLLP